MGGFESGYDVHLRLIGKHVVDFLLVIIELFSLAVMLAELRTNIDWKALQNRVGHFGRKFHVEEDIPYQPFVHG